MDDHKFPTNKVFINMTALRHNFREVKNMAGNRLVMAVVKSDGYGHGMVGSALTLSQAGADALGVIEVDEGLILREHGIDIPIYVMGSIGGPAQIELALRNDLAVFADGPEQIRLISDKAKDLGLTARIHIKVDTGLGRRGVGYEQAPDFFSEVVRWPNLEILGLATHMASSGDLAAHQQLEKFDNLCYKAHTCGICNSCDTALSSGGLVWHANHQAPMVRIGLMLYGVLPGNEIGPIRPDLRPAMTVISRITSIKEIAPGESIGYGHSFMARKRMRLAVVPFGFAQGLMRVRSNRGWALIKGRRAPQVGLISMNSSTYDITDIDDVALGDNVVILGRHSTNSIKAADLAAWCSTTPYEVLTLLGRLNPRYIEGSDYEEDACL